MFLRQRFITRHRSDILNSLITNNLEKLAPFIRKNSARFPRFLRLMLTWAIFSTTARRVTLSTWGPPHPCKQALKSQACLMSPVNMLICY